MTRLLILGATGSIGTTALDAVRNGKAEGIVIAGLAASSSPSLPGLGNEFNAPYAYLRGCDTAEVRAFIKETEPDIILNAIAGKEGLPASAAAAEMGIDIALANKESVVMGGRFLLSMAKQSGSRIIPVDSEHSAIYHLLKGRKARRLILTASGGPFIDRRDTGGVTVEEALAHPTWKMGKKITIDSATLANKGLEVMEASLLFGFPPESIEVTIHRQSVVHSAIETEEGAVYALMSPPDMSLPILTAILGEGHGLRNIVQPLPFSSGFSLTFSGWDRAQFPMLGMAYDALRGGDGMRIAYTAADEAAVNAFLDGRIAFSDIPEIVRQTLSAPYPAVCSSLGMIMEVSSEASMAAEALC